ncbi:hypothetical protein PENSUB_4448 [Penicillium subrubescens]|uniref:Uncharacterized protein n=1 Tax=Penicillium subrubescens TaxID=1316194 RepID=A0A1Q5UCF1_9EURO|nr:hypothetical protein PENSUB_4448 [Penicillium subrubescens]
MTVLQHWFETLRDRSICVLEVVDKQAQMFPMCRVLVRTIVYVFCTSIKLWEEMEEDVLLDLNPRQRSLRDLLSLNYRWLVLHEANSFDVMKHLMQDVA